MTVQSAPFYWITCDEPFDDCGARCPDLYISEITAWSDVIDAEDCARDSEWKTTTDGRHYCEEHALFVCDSCQAFDATSNPDDRNHLCSACLAAGAR